MQERGEGSVVVETLHSYREPLQAGDLLVIMSGLADFTDKILTLHRISLSRPRPARSRLAPKASA